MTSCVLTPPPHTHPPASGSRGGITDGLIVKDCLTLNASRGTQMGSYFCDWAAFESLRQSDYHLKHRDCPQELLVAPGGGLFTRSPRRPSGSHLASNKSPDADFRENEIKERERDLISML